MPKTSWVSLITVQDEFEANMIQALLENNQIEFEVQDAWFDPKNDTGPIYNEITISVKKNKFEQAQDLLNANREKR